MKFDKFKGMSEEKEIKENEKSNLEFLLEVCDEIVRKHASVIAEANDLQINEQYMQIYSSLKKELQEFNAQDLASLVFAKANNEYDENESKVLGLYTGILLHLLTERNNQKRQRTRFYINGQGNRFDYLFYFAKKVDELVIESFKGDHICASIASYKGKANKIILNSNKGNEIAFYAGNIRGNINIFIINNNEGDYTAWEAGRHKGNIKTFVINNSKGNYTAWEAGNCKGNINTFVINSNEGDCAVMDAGRHKGKIKTLIINSSKGDCAVMDAGSFEGKIKTLIINNSKGDYTAMDAGSDNGSINKIVLVSGEIHNSAEAKQIIRGEEALKEYQKISNKYKLEKVFAMLDSFKGKTPEEMITAAEKIGGYLGK